MREARRKREFVLHSFNSKVSTHIHKRELYHIKNEVAMRISDVYLIHETCFLTSTVLVFFSFTGGSLICFTRPSICFPGYRTGGAALL
jgi:hypothetical protein